MGTWGTGIGQNDTFCEVYEEFFTLYNRGYEIPEIKKILLEEFEELLEIEEVANELWFAVAKGQWECKALEQSVYDIVKEIIATEKDLKIWAKLDADDESLKKRKRALNNFLKKISQDKEVAKKRTKFKAKPPLFKKGDCIVFKMSTGNYGGAIVLSEEYRRTTCLNYIAKTNINKKEKPNVTDFKTAEILVVSRKYAEYDYEYDVHEIKEHDVEEIRGYYPSDLKKGMPLFEVIGNINIRNFRRCNIDTHVVANYKELIEYTETILKYIEQSNSTNINVFLNKYIGKE